MISSDVKGGINILKKLAESSYNDVLDIVIEAFTTNHPHFKRMLEALHGDDILRIVTSYAGVPESIDNYAPIVSDMLFKMPAFPDKKSLETAFDNFIKNDSRVTLNDSPLFRYREVWFLVISAYTKELKKEGNNIDHYIAIPLRATSEERLYIYNHTVEIAKILSIDKENIDVNVYLRKSYPRSVFNIQPPDYSKGEMGDAPDRPREQPMYKMNTETQGFWRIERYYRGGFTPFRRIAHIPDQTLAKIIGPLIDNKFFDY